MFDDDTSDSEEEVILPCIITEMAEEVEELFNGKFAVEDLWRAGMGGMRKTGIRSLYWRVFLGEVSIPKKGASVEDVLTLWEEELEAKRKVYHDLKLQHVVRPKSKDMEDDDEEGLAIDNPLSDHTDSSWNVVFKQSTIEREIKKDLTRMSDESRFFEKAPIPEILLNVLRLFSLEFPDPGYRQGMHDLLGAFVFHFCRNSHSIKTASTEEKKALKSSTLDLLTLVFPTDNEAIEADAYHLFTSLLTSRRSRLLDWYIVVKGNTRGGDETPIVRLCHRLQNTILPCYNPRLSNHLNEHGVEPTVYALRWFRVWFIREFGVAGSAPLWDCILCEILFNTVQDVDLAPLEATGLTPLEMGLMPLIGAAMLSYISTDLLAMDYSGTLKRLMRYPPVEDVCVFVTKALEWSDSPLKHFIPAAPVLPPHPEDEPVVIPRPVVKGGRPGVSVAGVTAPGGPPCSPKHMTGLCSNTVCRRNLREVVQTQHEIGVGLQNIIDRFQYGFLFFSFLVVSLHSGDLYVFFLPFSRKIEQY